MKTLLPKLSVIALLLAAGCVYETDEIYFKDIPPADPTITFVLNKHDQADTIYLTGPETFNFEVTITPGEIEKVEFVLDEEVLLTTNGGKITYPFEGHLLKKGVYDLVIRFTAKGGTNSLAENTGAEIVFMSRKWILKIDV